MIYDLLAPFYDEVNAEIDYSRWGDFIDRIVERECKTKPTLALDLGCGTGKMTLELASRGYDMTGIDYSPEMLDIARRRADECGTDVLWLCQDMREFELYGTVDLAVCALDGMNHLTSSADMAKCLSLVHNYLIPDGIFAFDINGKHKFENIYANNSYVMEQDSGMCVWQNFYNPRTKICDFYITLFRECSDGRYERFDETQRERMYTLRSIRRHLSDASFEFVGAYSDFDFTDATDSDERIYIVARCKK